MVLGTAFLIALYLTLKYILAWIAYFNNLDPRLGDSTMGYGGATGLEKKRIEDIIEKTKDLDKYHDTTETKK